MGRVVEPVLVAAPRRRLAWQLAKVVRVVPETSRTKSLVLDVPDWPGHLPGQHVDVRLTAEDGYQAQRGYSVSSPPEDRHVAITVERLDDGEVSPYLTDELGIGDQLELRGPIGGHFTWQVSQGGPLLLVAGGSGVVPLMAMIRHRAATGAVVPSRLLYSSRIFEDIIYRDELDRLAQDPRLEVFHTLTRAQPEGWTGYRHRIDRALLEEVAWSPQQHPHIFICGPTRLVEDVATTLTELGHDPARVKTERFGSTGG
jgi:ferredoxin-NADP reductase